MSSWAYDSKEGVNDVAMVQNKVHDCSRGSSSPKAYDREFTQQFRLRSEGQESHRQPRPIKHLFPNKIVITDLLTMDLTEAASSFLIELVRQVQLLIITVKLLPVLF